MSSEALINRMRKAREMCVDVGRFRFTVRRPTDLEAMGLAREASSNFDVARRFVVGWQGVRECDLLDSGGDDEIRFAAELWDEWLPNRPEFWQPLSEAVVGAYYAHVTARADAEKK